jgi:hypothetical protein
MPPTLSSETALPHMLAKAVTDADPRGFGKPQPREQTVLPRKEVMPQRRGHTNRVFHW